MEDKFMKKILIICIVILALNQNIFSEDEEKTTEKTTEKAIEKKADKKWTIQASPFLLFSDIYISDVKDMLFIMDLETQCKLSKYSNISITLSFLFNDRSISQYDYDPDSGQEYENKYHETYFQVGFKPMYIIRPNGTGIKGFFIGIYPNLGFRYNIVGDNNTLYTEVGYGLNLGYKWVLDSGFTLQVGGGLGKTYSIPPKNQDMDIYINSDGRLTLGRSDFSLDVKLGYSF
jgi:hypothetical protein